MPRREPLSIEERRYIYQQKMKGVSLSVLAQELGCSYYTVRKWWRRGYREGEQGLQGKRRGRPRRGPLSTYPEALRARIKALKCAHPRWGPDRILVELREEPQWRSARLPSRSQIGVYLRETCPEHVRRLRRNAFPPSQADASHRSPRDMGVGLQRTLVGGRNSCERTGYRR